MPDKNKYTFNISLSVLNHLGRNLYRNFVTVLGEAISNSWDADSNNVWIYIDREKAGLLIKDDGCGMTAEDFANKFLKVGYSKRGIKGNLTHSAKGRPYIGRKGIGKLALLSCAKRVNILTKTVETDYVGGIIDNSNLDNAISEDSTTYDLEPTNMESFKPFIENHKKGTIILFEDIHEGIKKSQDYLRKIIALYFRFSLIDNSFHIYLNDELISEKDLKFLAEKTQFLWNINTLDDPYVSQELTNLKNTDLLILDGADVKGFIASVEKPRDLKITETEEKVGIDLFVNGRLRERNVLRHMSNFSTRMVASYLYGQIHFNDLDGEGEDSFTTSRESIKEGNEKYEKLLNALRENMLEKISDTWDDWRLKVNEEGDDENPRKTKVERRVKSLYDFVSREYQTSTQNPEVGAWIKELELDAGYNIPAYINCYLSENLLRLYIKNKGSAPVSCMKADLAGKTCEDRYNQKEGNTSLCEYCKGERGKKSLIEQKGVAGTSIQIRVAEDNLLMYLDYLDLAKIIDDTILKNEDKPYKPLRNSVMHTSLLTQEAKTKLTSVFDNVKETIKKLDRVNAGKNVRVNKASIRLHR